MHKNLIGFDCKDLNPPNLLEYKVDRRSKTLESLNGVLYTKIYDIQRGQHCYIYYKRVLASYPAGRKDKIYIVPKWTEAIGDYAFCACRYIEKIKLPAAIEIIGRRAFLNCVRLREINIPRSVQSIGEAAFRRCFSLERISFSEGITNIGPYTFDDCSSLKEITLPESLKRINKYAFYNCPALKTARLSAGTKLDSHVFPDETSLIYYEDEEDTDNYDDFLL